MNHKLWLVCLTVGAVGLDFYALKLGPGPESLVYVSYSALAAAAIFTGIFLYRPRPMVGWLLFGAGQACSALADYFSTQILYLQRCCLSEALPGGLYLAGQFAFLLGLAVIYFAYRRNVTPYAVSQGAILCIGLTAVLWVMEISPNLSRGFTWLEWVWNLAFPASLAIFLTMASIFLMTSVGSPWSFKLMFASLICYGIGYQFYKPLSSLSPLNAQSALIVQAGSLFTSSSVNLVYFNDLIYSTAYLLLGLAFLHPSMMTYHDRLPLKNSIISRIELVLLGAAFWMAPVAFTVNNLRRENTDMLVIVASMTVIFTLVEWRLARMVQLLDKQNQHLRKHRELLRHQAYHDPLTGLPNRAYLYKQLDELLGRSRLEEVHGAVLLMDVDHFKQVNDTLGHDVGDQVLKEVADALTRLKRKDDVVGRWGGDEFMFIMEATRESGHATEDESADAQALARRLEQEVRWTVRGDEGEVNVSISIGICLIPALEARLQTIVKQADLALYQAKRSGDSAVVYTG